MKVYQNNSFAMGTRFNILLPGVDIPKGDMLFSLCSEELNRLENMLSCFIENSSISKINRYAFENNYKVNDELFQVLEDCLRYRELTQGAFDIGIGKLIDYWNGNQKEEDLETLVQQGGVKNILLDKAQNTIRFKSSCVKINPGGYGKGYALQKIQDLLKSYGISTAFISFGESSVSGLGKHPFGDYWPVGIQDTYQKDKSIATIKLTDQSVSTSGNMEEENHIIHPQNGIPVKEKKMVSVKSQSAIEAEVLSTALIAADTHQRKKIIKAFPEIEVIEINYSNQKADILKINI
jgi:thiamine biosynthesis lipoprotein